MFDLTAYPVQPQSGSATVSGVQIGDGTTLTAALALGGSLLTTGSNGIAMLANAGAATFNMPITLSSSQTFTNNSGSVLTLSNSITNGNYLLSVAGSGTTDFSGTLFSGSGGLTMNAPGLLQISGSNNSSQSPAVTVNGGTLQLAGGSNRLPVNTTLALANSAGSAFDLNSQSQTIQYLSGGGAAGGNVTLGTATLTIAGGNTASETFAGVISGSGSVGKTGNCTMLLSGQNTYSGGTTIGNGVLTANADSISSGGNVLSGPFGTGPITFTGGTLTPSDTNTRTIGNPLIFSDGASGATLTNYKQGNLTLTGPVTVSAGTNTVSSYDSTSLNGPISGPGALNLTVAGGTIVFAGSNTFAGGVTLAGAQARLGQVSQGGAGNIISGPLGTGPLAIDSGILSTDTGTSGLVRQIFNPVTINGSFQLGNYQDGSGIRLSGPITLNCTPTITVRGGAGAGGSGIPQGSAEIDGNLTGGNGITITYGEAPLILAGNNTYSGTTTLSPGLLEAGATTGFSPNSTVVITSGNAQLQLNGFSNAIASLTSALGIGGTVDNGTATAATLTFGGDNTSTTYSGKFTNSSGTLSLTKVGSGAFTYVGGVANGYELYKGTTNVSGGTIAFDYSQYALGAATTGTTALSNQFASNNSPLVLAGGTFQLNGRASGTVTTLASATWSGTNSSTISVASTNGLVAGEAVTSTGFQSGAYVVAVTSPTTFTLSKATTANSSNAAVTVTTASFACSQTFNGLTLNPGSSVIDANNVTGAQSTTIDLRGSGSQGISRTAGGLVDFTAANGTLGSTALIKTDQANNASGILGGWATVSGGSGYAASNGTANIIVPYAAYTTINTQGSAISSNSASNIQIGAVAGSGNDTLATSTVNVNTIFQNTAASATIATAADLLRLGPAGGILLSPTAGSLAIGVNPGDGTLTAGNSSLTQGGELILNNNAANPLVVNASIADNGPGAAVTVTKAGAGSVVLAGGNTFSGGLIINAGLLQLGGSNTFSGGLNINGGLVQLTGSGALNAASPNSVTFNSALCTAARLQLYGNSVTIGGLSSPLSPAAIVESGSPTGSTDVLTLSTAGANFYGGVLQNGSSGTLGLGKSGSGSLTLYGQNTYSGGTTINAGVLALGSSGAIGSAGTITFGGGTLQFTGSNTTDYSNYNGTNRFSNAANQAYDLDTNGQTVTIAGNLTSSGGSLAKLGNGVLIVNGAGDTYNGGTLVAAGMLQLGTSAALGATSGNLTVNGGTLDLHGYSPTVGALIGNFGGVITSLSGSATLTTDSAGATTFAGSILSAAGNPVNLVLAGPGSLTLTGSSAFGSTALNNGMLIVANASGSALGSGPLTLNGGTLASGIVGGLAGPVFSGNGPYVISPGGVGQIGILALGSNLSLGSSATLTFDISGSSADLLSIGGALAVAGTATINVNTSGALANSYTLATFQSDPNVAVSNFTLTGGTGYGLQLKGNDLVLVAGLPSWMGASAANWSNSGNWTYGPAPNAVGAMAAFNNSTGTAMAVTLDAPETVGTLVFGNTGRTPTGYTLNGTGSNTLTLSNTGNAPSSIQVVGGTHGINAPVVLADNLVVSGSGTGWILGFGTASSITPSGVESLTMNAAGGTLILSGSDSYCGTIVEAGTLIVTSDAALPDGTNLNVGPGGTFIFDPSQTVAGRVAGASFAASPAVNVVRSVPEPGTLVLVAVAALASACGVWRSRLRRK